MFHGYGTLFHGDVTSKTCEASHELTHEITILGNYEMKLLIDSNICLYSLAMKCMILSPNNMCLSVY